MLRVLDGTADLLFDAGFAIQSPVPPFRSKHGFSSLYAPSETLYYNTTYVWDGYVGCTVGFDSQNVAVSFADNGELVSFPPSRHANDAQRQKIRVLARRVAGYLHTHLPAYYHITTSFPDDGLTTRSSERAGR